MIQKNKQISKKEAVSKKIASFSVEEPTLLMDFLTKKLTDKSRTTIKSYLSHNQILINNKIITKFDFPLQKGDTVVIGKTAVREDFSHPKLRIVFEDKYIIVIEKREGLLSIANAKEKIQTAYSILSRYVKKENPKNKIFVIHRLDRETSGLLIFAKDEKTQELLQKDWQNTVIQRNYIALVEGIIKPDTGVIKSWLKENKALVVYSSTIPNDGKLAITHYKTLKHNDEYALLSVHLETGRKNQIRAHMQHIQHPIVGDKKYGAKTNPIRRIGLHANLLAFKHPYSGKELFFEIKTPKAFYSVF